MNPRWKQWDDKPEYGDTLFKRATGELPEMESSKKLAKELQGVLRDGDSLLDVACGAGHYLRSLRRVIGDTFTYTGADATAHYIARAKEAFASDKKASFVQGDIYKLDFADRSFDVVMANNVLLHLPTIKKPLEELVRVARRKVFCRALIGSRTFLVRDVWPGEEEFDEAEEPKSWSYYNIYSEAHVRSLLARMPRVKDVRVELDRDFDKGAVMASAQREFKDAANATTILGDYQVNTYLLLPWSILEVTLQ